MGKRQLKFYPTDDEEEYLDINGKLDSWTDTVRTWIKQDRQKNKKQIIDKTQYGILLIVMGIISFALTYFLPISLANIIVIIVLFSISAIAVTFGSISVIWELYLHARG